MAVANADGEKCERCWRWEPSVGSHDEHATLHPLRRAVS